MTINPAVTNIAKTDLLARAQAFENKVENDGGFPYKDAVRDENDFFVGQLEKASGNTLSEIRDAAVASSAAASKKAQLFSIGGTALLVASFLVPLPANASMLRLVGMGAGFVLSNIVAGRAAQTAAVDKKFAAQLTEWETALSNGAAAPSQPPAAQPAPAPAAAQTQA